MEMQGTGVLTSGWDKHGSGTGGTQPVPCSACLGPAERLQILPQHSSRSGVAACACSAWHPQLVLPPFSELEVVCEVFRIGSHVVSWVIGTWGHQLGPSQQRQHSP